MQTLNQLSTLQFQNNIVANALDKPDKSSLVYDLSGGYNVFDFIITRLGGGSARQISGLNGVFQKPIMGNSTPTAQLSANATQSGNNLVLTFTDPQFNLFRLKEVIGDGTANMNQGRIIAKAPGTVTIEPTPATPTLTANTHFLAGKTIVPLYPAAGSRGSTGMESLYEYGKYVTNQTSISRESLTLYRRDMSQTWVEFAGDYWYTMQEKSMMERWARSLEKKAYWSVFGNQSSSLEGDVPYSMGLRQAIKDPERGGVVLPLTGALTTAQFDGWIARIADRQNTSTYSITLGVGRGFLNWIQGFNSDYIKYQGKANTFGGEGVKGLDTYVYAVNGVTVNLIMIPFFNDRNMFPDNSTAPGVNQNFTRMSYTAVVLDTSMYTSVDGKTLPAMEKVYFGDQEVLYGYVPGMIGSSLTGNTLFKQGDVKLAVTDKDAASIEIFSDCAYDFICYKMGLAELMF